MRRPVFLVEPITRLKSTRGDSLTFRMLYGKETFNLDALPAEGTTSESHRGMYQETVRIEATVVRDTLYKKPKLRLRRIDLKQSELKLE